MIVNANGLGLSFGDEEVFSGVSFRISRGDRCALVGVNGSGKTSLCRIVAGDIEPTEGHVSIARGIRVAYLPQHLSMFPDGKLLRRVVLHSGSLRATLGRIRDIEEQLSTREGPVDQESLLRELGEAQDELEASSFYSLRHRAEKVLMGLGFGVDQFENQLSTFSGGWRMRAELAALLVSEPDLLLLDEPTNHLDLDARLWLEEYLSSIHAAVWVISHDPVFLDRIARRVYELEFGSLRDYSGNYSWYEQHKAREIADRQKQAALQAARMEKLERFISRFRANEKKRFLVRSRMKMLERMEVIETHRSPRRMRVRFPDPPRSSLKVVELRDVSKSYDHTVFEDVSLVIEREDRIGIVGRNGEGKSTLSRLLAGIEQASSGTIRQGSNVSLGYYSQEVDSDLDPGLDLIEQIRSVTPQSTEGEIRTWLGMFLFTGDDVFKKTGVLSGGEKSRLALARILFTPVNLLILDEPTNHLDIFSREVLREGLVEYRGTLVLISHDEDLLSATVRKVIEVGEARVREFRGSFDYYLGRRREALRRELAEEREEETSRQPDSPATREEKRSRKREEAAQRNSTYRQRRALETRLGRIEEKLLPMEERLSEIEGLLADPEVLSEGRRIVELQKEHAYISREAQALRERWDELAGSLGKLEQG
ncbi:ABC-F family ATP-binding cassette domain-containing protein [Candidatus Fermentibacterales bacterium]|nr:ABC-F family ATP-binding cassette domain-containing protein [Candidatus Fermentibacterales bacterium]